MSNKYRSKVNKMIAINCTGSTRSSTDDRPIWVLAVSKL